MNLVLLHGYTQNGRVFREDLGPLLERLPALGIVAPDAPWACDPAGLERLASTLGVEASRAPHLTWWRATDDGSAYEGWELARERLGELLERHAPAGVLGFSQGAMLAACVAAWSARGEVPPVAFAVMVAGRVPRAAVLKPLFGEPIAVPSLHVWGSRDSMAPMAPDLAARFVDPELLTWGGPHVVPTRGAASDGIVAFLQRYAADPTVASHDRHRRQ